MPRKKAPTADERLGSLDCDQLEALVRRLLEHRPELEDVIHLPLPGEQLQVDPTLITGQVRRILRNMGSDWQASYRTQFELHPIVAVGDGYLERDLVDDARGVYVAVAQAIIEVYAQIRDEESEIGGIVVDCAKGLGRCLEHTSDTGHRETLLADLFTIYRWDELETGGYGIADPVREVLTAQANDDERREGETSRPRRALDGVDPHRRLARVPRVRAGDPPGDDRPGPRRRLRDARAGPRPAARRRGGDRRLLLRRRVRSGGRGGLNLDLSGTTTTRRPGAIETAPILRSPCP